MEGALHLNSLEVLPRHLISGLVVLRAGFVDCIICFHLTRQLLHQLVVVWGKLIIAKRQDCTEGEEVRVLDCIRQLGGWETRSYSSAIVETRRMYGGR
jgi:hypothetical protein